MLGDRARRALGGTVALAAVALAAPATAPARAERAEAVVREAFVADARGMGCVEVPVARPSSAVDVVATEPQVGELVGSIDVVEVSGFGADGTTATWTVRPPRAECEVHGDDERWEWETGERAWTVSFRDRRYVVRAGTTSGIRSLAGFRVDGTTRSTRPTIRRARRALGRPTSVRRTDGVTCRAHWRRLGLRVVFVNFGGREPCRVGFAQAASIDRRHAPSWTAVVGREPGVVSGTPVAFLEEESLASPDEFGRDLWTLAEVFSPYGEPGYIPSVSARTDRAGAVTGFELWIGAGGD